MNQHFIRFLRFLFFTLLTVSYASAQSSFIPLNDDYYHLIDRLEIKRGKFADGFHYNVKPFERKTVVALTDSIIKEDVDLTSRDKETIDYIREDSWEWAKNGGAFDSAHYNKLARLGWFKKLQIGKNTRFWEHPADLYSVHNKDFDLHFNFVTTNFIGNDSDTQKPLWFTGRGVEIRGMVDDKLGFYTFVSDNQGMFPRYVREFLPQITYAFPGEGLAKTSASKGTIDFLTARGYITFKPIKSINLRFGHDHNVFGSGYRSLILSDNSSPYLFLRLDTKIGRFNYTNLWTSMLDASINNELRKKKFAAIHHLSVNVTEKLNIGIFEAEVFNRDSVGGGYDLNYLNPIIFYRYVESYIGSHDNALLGFDFRWLVGHKASVYSQFVLDEFLTKYLFNGSGSWANKYSFQLGTKYVDAFGIRDLDLQAEYNVVRPYTYSHKDGGRNYAHYGQSLTNPLGANFREYLGIVRYKPTSRLSIYGTFMYARKGKDPDDATNYGGDIMKSYETRRGISTVERDFGHRIGQGVLTKTSFADLRVSYSLAHNLFLDGRYLKRFVNSDSEQFTNKANIFSIAVRYNMAYRQQTF